MHQQIKASPDDTAENVQRIVNALAARDINIQAIAPDFDPPHVRVLVAHGDYRAAVEALSDEGLTPEERSAVAVPVPDRPGALKAAMVGLAKRGFTVESILVVPAVDQQGMVRVSFGVARGGVHGWDEQQAEELAGELGAEL
jgi:hypothetical protein